MDYPLLGLQAQLTGEVRLSLDIDKEGNVKNVTVNSGNTVLGKAAKKNLEQWRFVSEAIRENVSSKSKRLEFIYVFLLDDGSSKSAAKFKYQYPNKVTVLGKAPHWQP